MLLIDCRSVVVVRTGVIDEFICTKSPPSVTPELPILQIHRFHDIDSIVDSRPNLQYSVPEKLKELLRLQYSEL